MENFPRGRSSSSGGFGHFSGVSPGLQRGRVDLSEKAFLPRSVFHKDLGIRTKHPGDVEPGFGHAFGIHLAGDQQQIDRPQIIGPLRKHGPGVAWVKADLGTGLAEGAINLFEGDPFPKLRGRCLEKINPRIKDWIARNPLTDYFQQPLRPDSSAQADL